MTRLSAVNMEEREALKREIEVLQDLIDNHKRIHGDTPFTRVQPPEAQRSSRAHGTILGNSYGSRGRNDPPQNHGSWKRKYSLRHKSPQSAHPFISTSCNHRDATPPVSSGGAPHSPRDVTRTTATVTTNVSRKAEPLVPRHEHSKAESCSASEGTQLMAESRRVFPPGSTDPNRRHRLAPVATAAPAVLTTITPSVAALPKLAKQPPSNLSSHSGHCQTTKSVSTNSKFVWVKTQNVKGQSSSVSTPAGKTGNDLPPSKPGAESTVASTVWKKTPGKKPPRRLTQVSVSPKASKYKWVSSYAQSKISRKSMSSKLPLPQRALETDDTLRKAKTALTSPAKTKKEVATSSRSSHYSWKAVAAAGPAVPRRSSFYWTPDKRRVREGFSSGTLRTILPCPPPSSCSPGPFKLHSQMKIIRRSANSGSEKVSSTPGGRLTTPGRPPASLRGPTGARRTSSRELVSFGRHKLRRLVTSVTRTSPPSTFSSGALPDFGSSRYRSRRGPSAAHAHQDPPSLSWRARRVQSARSFLQSRLRTHQDTHPSSSQHWRGGSMCWIRGSLYRVSANKLSRTVASGPAVNRTGKSFSSTQTSMMTWNRCSSTRHLASRAVQRSLAIIRQARQKKQAKQYCMYYNRFGKCNRGNSCPYIHDPDKVAVCTRFLRGTCKKAEGICPFSHKVAKEKMPVCSYFLKGICSNNDCPYSHVYVSKKAEVCEDFVKGYCPEGEKCKKKHTLVCPDFSKMGSCPQGASCKLQHRQRAKRTSASTADTPAKRARSREPPNRPGPPGAGGPDRQATPPLDLPSFISLSSSPEEADAPDPQLADPRHGKETRLQIKPRL